MRYFSFCFFSESGLVTSALYYFVQKSRYSTVQYSSTIFESSFCVEKNNRKSLPNVSKNSLLLFLLFLRKRFHDQRIVRTLFKKWYSRVHSTIFESSFALKRTNSSKNPRRFLQFAVEPEEKPSLAKSKADFALKMDVPSASRLRLRPPRRPLPLSGKSGTVRGRSFDRIRRVGPEFRA